LRASFRRAVPSQRLHTQTVASQRQPAARFVPDRKCKHAAQPAGERVDTPFPIACNQYFGVALRMEAMAPLFQFSADVDEVIDAAIEDHADLAIVGKHGLRPGRAQIEDCQPAMAEPHPRPCVKPFRVGAAAR